MTVEDFIYRTDPYRSSSSEPRFPLPMNQYHYHPNHLRRIDEAGFQRQEVESLLTNHGIHSSQKLFIPQSKPGYPRGGDKPRMTLVIHVDVQDNMLTTSWSAARRDIKDLLDEHGLTEIEVEIVDPQRFYQPSLFATSPVGPNAELYRRARDDLLAVVRERLGEQWTSMSMYQVGRTAQRCSDALVITVKPWTEHDWLILRTMLKQTMRQHGSYEDQIGIEIFPGGWSNPDCSEPVGKSFVSNFNQSPRMGCSVGIEDQKGSGSLGGFFKLHWDRQVYNGFLTNSHVVKPDFSKENEKAFQELDEQGLEPNTTPKKHVGRTVIEYFSSDDTKASLIDALEQIEIRNQRKQQLIKEIEEREMIGKNPNQAKIALQRTESFLAQSESALTALKAMPRRLGITTLASGRGINHEGQLLDYAFVACFPDPTGSDAPVYFNFDKGHFLKPTHTIGANSPKYHEPELKDSYDIPPGSKIEDTSKIEAGQWYCKIGRTSGFTTGICNGFESYINGLLPRWIRGENGKYVKQEGTYSKELVIINSKKGLPHVLFQEHFSEPGDSGSLVIDSRGRVAGLLFGSLHGEVGPLSGEQGSKSYARAGLVTSIDAILEDVASRSEIRTKDGKIVRHGKLELAM